MWATLFVAAHAVQAQIVFTNVFRSGTNLQFDILAPAAQSCVIQAADSFNTAQWTDVSATTQGTLTFPFDRPHRFFRIKCGNEYSRNVVGYVTLTIQPRFSLIANPLVARTNSVEVLFAGVPDGTSIYKFSSGKYTVNGLEFGEWSNPSQTLVPGEGAFLWHAGPGPISVIFTGEVASGYRTNTLPAGLSIASNFLPVPGMPYKEIGLIFGEGDVIYRFDNSLQRFFVHGYELGTWSREPYVIIGEAFFLNLPSPRTLCPWCDDFP